MLKIGSRSELSIFGAILNTAWSRTIILVGGLVITTVASRFLTTSELGVYFFLVSIVTVVGTCCLFGTERYIVRVLSSGEMSESKKQQETYRSVKLLVYVLFCVLTLAAVFQYFIDQSFVSYKPGEMYLPLMTAIWLACSVFMRFFAEVARGLFLLRLSNFVLGPLHYILILMILAIVALRGGDFSALALVAAHITANILCGAILLLKCKAKLRLSFRNCFIAADNDFSYLKKIKKLWALAVLTIADAAVLNLDLIIVSLILGVDAAAVYGVATRLSSLVLMPLAVANQALMPKISAYYGERNNEALIEVLRSSACIASLVSVMMTIAFYFFGEVIIGVLFGSSLIDALPVLLVMSIARLVVVALGGSGITLIMAGLEKNVLIAYVVQIAFFLTVIPLLKINSILLVTLVFSFASILAKLICSIQLFRLTGIVAHSFFARNPLPVLQRNYSARNL